MTITPRLEMPLLMPGQAQKELVHNEALSFVDILLHASVKAFDTNLPPENPQPGECWLVGLAPQGAWAEARDMLACWTENGWRFVKPFRGLRVSHIDDGLFARWDGESWVSGEVFAQAIFIGGQQVLGPQQPAINAPSGGSVVDVEARSCIDDILNVLRTHGMIAAMS